MSRIVEGRPPQVDDTLEHDDANQTVDNTELQVRTAVANYFAKISQKMYAESPALLATMKEGMRTDLERTLSEITKDDGLSTREKFTLTRKLDDTLSEMYSPEKRAQEVAEFWIKGKDFYESTFGSVIGLLESDEKSEEVITEIRAIYSSLLQYAKRRDKIVNNLIANVQNKGLGTATTNEAIKSAVVEEFPTKENYESAFKEMAKAGTKLMEVVTSLFKEEGEESVFDKVLPPLMTRLMDSYQNTVIKADTEILYQD